jgi:hypothetical protein
MGPEPAGTGRQNVFADHPADLLEHRDRLARRVQRLALPPGKDPRPRQGVDPVGLVRLGDRRKAHEFPILLRQHMADQIVPQVTPEGRLSCIRCMIRMIAPFSLSLRRL